MREGDVRAKFIARLTAGATHEVRNVLAIVKESGGLIDDLLTLAGPDAAPDPSRVRSALERIESQVGRGAAVLASLNRVAHGLDQASEPVDLAEAIRHVVCLCQRFAHERRRKVAACEAGGSVYFTGNALDVYRALAAGLDWYVEQVPEGTTIRVRAISEDAGDPAVRFEVAPDPGAPPPGLDRGSASSLASRLAELPATPRGWNGDGALTLVFT